MSERVYLAEDEEVVYQLHPLSDAIDQYGSEVPDGFTARWESASAEFDACQEIMRAASAARPEIHASKPR